MLSQKQGNKVCFRCGSLNQFKNNWTSWAVVAHAFNHSNWELEAGGFLSLRPAYRVSTRTARAIQRNPVFKNQKPKKKKKKEKKKKDCTRNRGTTSKQSGYNGLGVCLPCKMGNHWARECKSRTDIQGCPMPSQLMGPWSCCQAREIHFLTYQGNPRKCRIEPLFHHPRGINPRNGS